MKRVFSVFFLMSALVSLDAVDSFMGGIYYNAGLVNFFYFPPEEEYVLTLKSIPAGIGMNFSLFFNESLGMGADVSWSHVRGIRVIDDSNSLEFDDWEGNVSFFNGSLLFLYRPFLKNERLDLIFTLGPSYSFQFYHDDIIIDVSDHYWGLSSSVRLDYFPKGDIYLEAEFRLTVDLIGLWDSEPILDMMQIHLIPHLGCGFRF